MLATLDSSVSLSFCSGQEVSPPPDPCHPYSPSPNDYRTGGPVPVPVCTPL